MPFVLSLLLIFIRTVFYLLSGISLNLSELLIEWELFECFRSHIFIIFIFDYISVLFLRVVRLISGAVIIFRVSYINFEVYYRRFILIVTYLYDQYSY